MNAKKLEVKWETKISPVRPFYEGTDVVMTFGDPEDGTHSIKKAIGKKHALVSSEIVILDTRELNP